MSHFRELNELPKFVGSSVTDVTTRLLIEGDVLETKALSLEEIASLPTVKLTEDFECLEGWVVRDVLWEGVPISEIVKENDLKPDVKSLLFCSGGYTTSLDLKTAFKRSTILALKKWNKNLDVSEGGPLRLVFEGHDCYESVKSVDRIVACTNLSEGSAQKIAMERLQKSEGTSNYNQGV